MLQRLHKLFAYDDWANRETLESLKRTGNPPPRSLRYLGHILAAEWLWLERLGQPKKAPAVWPETSLDQCEAQLADLRGTWQHYLGALTPETLAEPITYTNTKGEAWSNTIEDVLLHVVMHSGYHRGQIAADLRASGHTPAYTDYIQAVRQGSVK